MKYQVVLPYTHLPYYTICRDLMAPELQKNTLFIDNTDKDKNLGCMISHNYGWAEAKRKGADWLIIMSPAIRFGGLGGMDFIEQLSNKMDHYVVHAESLDTASAGRNAVFGWHLSAFKLDLLEQVGGWDVNLSPYSLCDICMSIRIQKYKKGAPGWGTAPCDVRDTTMGHSINLAGIEAPYPPRNDYFTAKYGRGGGEWKKEAYDHPFNDETKPLSWWPVPPDPRALEHDYWRREPYKMDENRIVIV